MRKSDKPKARRDSARPVGLFNQREVKAMLGAFGRMSLHDQAAIYSLIHSRATANAQTDGRSA